MSKIQISKIIQPDGFLSSLLSKIPGPLMKVAVSSPKTFLAPLGKAAASAIDAGIQMDDIIKIFQVLEDSNISLKGITKAIENDTN